MGCATKCPFCSEGAKEAAAEAQPPAIVEPKKEAIVHNDEQVIVKLKTLCPFSLRELHNGNVVKIDCGGKNWAVKNNEITVQFKKEKKPYSIDVIKEILFIDGVDIKKKGTTYEIDAPD